MHKWDFTNSHSSIVAGVEHGGSYSCTRRLWSAVCDKVFECRNHNADQNSSLAVPGLKPHTARRSTYLLQEFIWKVFNHYPSYSPDLAPRNCHVFLHPNKFQPSQSFQNDREAEVTVTVVPILGGRLIRHRIKKLVLRYDKYLIFGGEYVEKYFYYDSYLKVLYLGTKFHYIM